LRLLTSKLELPVNVLRRSMMPSMLFVLLSDELGDLR
jgi:hypothetical protein